MEIKLRLSDSESRHLIKVLDGSESNESFFIKQKIRALRIAMYQQEIQNYVKGKFCTWCDDSGFEDWAGFCMIKCRKGCQG